MTHIYLQLKKLQDIVIIDKLTSYPLIHNKSSRFKGRTINVLLTNQSQVHPKGVTKARVIGALEIALWDSMKSASIATLGVVHRRFFNWSFLFIKPDLF